MQATVTAEEFTALSVVDKIKWMFCYPNNASRANFTVNDMQKFVNDHVGCLSKYFKTGRKECIVIAAGDGHALGFDPSKYNQGWKKAFATKFSDGSQKFRFTGISSPNWQEEFKKYLEIKNAHDSE